MERKRMHAVDYAIAIGESIRLLLWLVVMVVIAKTIATGSGFW